MRLFENLRSAEKKGVKMMRQGVARAREEWEDVERRIRQGMRMYPQKLLKKKRVAAASDAPVELRPDTPAKEPGSPARAVFGTARDGVEEPLGDAETRKPIVSVHGRDVGENELDKPAA
jgi:hypothetical protein